MMHHEAETVSIATEGNTIDYGLYGSERQRTGITKVVLAPVTDSFPAVVGTEVTYRVVAIHREVVEQ